MVPAPITRNELAQQLGAVVADLPAGLYRSQMTICRIRLGTDGLEAGSEVVMMHAADFNVGPAALPPAKGDGP